MDASGTSRPIYTEDALLSHFFFMVSDRILVSGCQRMVTFLDRIYGQWQTIFELLGFFIPHPGGIRPQESRYICLSCMCS